MSDDIEKIVNDAIKRVKRRFDERRRKKAEIVIKERKKNEISELVTVLREEFIRKYPDDVIVLNKKELKLLK